MQYQFSNLLRFINKSVYRTYSTMSNTYVKRTTLFKVPKKEDIETVLKQYETLRKTAVKVRLIPFSIVICSSCYEVSWTL